MRQKLLRLAKFLMYPFAYVFFLAMFGYLTFPYSRMKDRVIAEFEAHAKPGSHLTIGSLSSYWFTGLEMSDVKITLPPSTDAPMPATPFGPAETTPAKETVITVDAAHVRLRMLPLLIGRLKIDFTADVFGGEIRGSAPINAAGDVEVEWEKLDVGKMDMVAAAVGGLPVKGTASGKIDLSPVDGKFSKSNGEVDLTITGVSIGDGKAKVLNLIELPTAKAGDLTIEGEVKDGTLTFKKIATTGPDVDLIGDGHIAVKEPWDASNADVYIRFKFSDGYKTKSDNTKSLLGDPSSPLPPLIENDARMKRSKRSDGYYGWHIHGELKRLRFDPASSDAIAGRKTGASTSRPDAPFAPKRPAIGGLPLGASTAAHEPRDRGEPPPREPVNFRMPSAMPDSPPPPPPPQRVDVPPPPPPQEQQQPPPEQQQQPEQPPEQPPQQE